MATASRRGTTAFAIVVGIEYVASLQTHWRHNRNGGWRNERRVQGHFHLHHASGSWIRAHLWRYCQRGDFPDRHDGRQLCGAGPAMTTISWEPSQQTCWPFPSELSTLVPDDPNAPIKFCLAAILTHLNGRASDPFTPAVCVRVVAVKAVEVVSNCPVWPFEPQGPAPGVKVRLAYLSQQSWSSR